MAHSAINWATTRVKATAVQSGTGSGKVKDQRWGLPSEIALPGRNLESRIVYRGVGPDFKKPNKYFRLIMNRVANAIAWIVEKSGFQKKFWHTIFRQQGLNSPPPRPSPWASPGYKHNLCSIELEENRTLLRIVALVFLFITFYY